MKRIAFFDFDGTITTRDTLLAFIRYQAGTFAYCIGFLLYSPWLVAYRLQIISNHLAKEKILRHFFGNMPLGKFDQLCEQFCRDVLPQLIRKKSLHEINLLKTGGAEIVVVSASPENWVGRWCADTGIQCLSTKLVTNENKLTGRIAGRNCHGNEKVNRIRDKYKLEEYDEIICYGDTNGDKPMLQLATIAFYKPFR